MINTTTERVLGDWSASELTADNTLQKWMHSAYQAASLSEDPSTQVGAVVVRQLTERSHIIVNGFNHMPRGMSIQNLTKEEKYKYIIHAEHSAILGAASLGVKTKGSIMVAPWACCECCAHKIVEAGISTLVVDQIAMDRTPNRWKDSIEAGHEYLLRNGVGITTIRYEGEVPNLMFDGNVIVRVHTSPPLDMMVGVDLGESK